MDYERRRLIASLSLLATGLPALALAQPGQVDVEGILNDPEAPTAGNARGDVTLVAFLDYNCPHCKKTAPDLARAVKEDGMIRLVYKDWPVITETSVYAAQLALASSYQGAYERVHHALMAAPGKRLNEEQFLAAVKSSGIDMNRLQADLDANAEQITALLRRTMAQADSLGLQGSPTYLIGPLRASTLDYNGFKAAIAEARKRQSKQ